MKIDIVDEYTFDKAMPSNLSRVRTQMQSLEVSPTNRSIQSPQRIEDNLTTFPLKMRKNLNAMLSKINVSRIKFKSGLPSFHPQIKWSGIKIGNVVSIIQLTIRNSQIFKVCTDCY